MNIVEGQVYQVQGSGKLPYEVKKIGEVISCSCPAWRNQRVPINKRTCKHIRKLNGEETETGRIGSPLSVLPPAPKNDVAVLLAQKWTKDVDPTGWWMSEKLDGMRALWTGKEFLSRKGNHIYAPTWFTDDLGRNKLDGELWLGRKMFQKSISILRSQGLDQEWKAIQYQIFDIPDVQTTFEDRYWLLKGMTFPSQCVLVAQTLCTGAGHLENHLKAIEALGGEGVMLRQPGSLYEGYRSNTLLKVKSFFDAEAIVIGWDVGKGRHLGRLGSYVCRMPNGKEFNVGSGITDANRDIALPIGTKITYRYTELTDGGIPRFPTFVGEAIDK